MRRLPDRFPSAARQPKEPHFTADATERIACGTDKTACQFTNERDDESPIRRWCPIRNGFEFDRVGLPGCSGLRDKPLRFGDCGVSTQSSNLVSALIERLASIERLDSENGNATRRVTVSDPRESGSDHGFPIGLGDHEGGVSRLGRFRSGL